MLYEITFADYQTNGSELHHSTIVEAPSHRDIGRVQLDADSTAAASHWMPPAVVVVADEIAADWARQHQRMIAVTISGYLPRRLGWTVNNSGAMSYALAEYTVGPHDPPSTPEGQRAIARIHQHAEPY